MKKLFLTSGIIACMACPAFATGFTPQQGTTAWTGDNANGTIADACTQPNIGAYSGSTQLVAQWTPLGHAITLDSDRYVSTYQSGNTAFREATTDADPSIVWTVYGYADSTTGHGVFQYDSTNSTGTSTPVTNLTSNTPALTGYTFNGFWSDKTAESGEGVVQFVNASGVVNDALSDYYYNTNNETIYAHWTPIQYTVSYNVNTPAGTASTLTTPGTQNVTFDLGSNNDTLTIAPALSADGYEWAGWTGPNLSAASGDTTYNGGDTVSSYNRDANPTLTAQWTPRTYTITYSCEDGEGGTGTPDSQASRSATYYADFVWAGNSDATQCHRNGYHFTGWDCTNPAGATIVNNAGVSCDTTTHVCTGAHVDNQHWTFAGIANNGTVTCVAHYEPNSIGLSWTDSIGSATYQGGESCTYDNDIQLPANPTKTGYEFAGWAVGTVTQDTTLGTQQ